MLARFRFAGRRLLGGLLTAAFVLPTVVMGAAFLALLPGAAERGVVAILAAHVTFNLAVVVRTVGAVWQHLPEDMEAAAATLGASPWRVAREVTLPLLWPAILAAASIVFVFTFTSYGVVRVLGGPGRSTIEVEIWRRATQLGDTAGAAILAVGQLLVIGLVVWWSARLQRRHTRALGLRPLARRRRPRRGRERGLVAVDRARHRRHRRRAARSRSSSARCAPVTGGRWRRGGRSGDPRSGAASASASIPSTRW